MNFLRQLTLIDTILTNFNLLKISKNIWRNLPKRQFMTSSIDVNFVSQSHLTSIFVKFYLTYSTGYVIEIWRQIYFLDECRMTTKDVCHVFLTSNYVIWNEAHSRRILTKIDWSMMSNDVIDFKRRNEKTATPFPSLFL